MPITFDASRNVFSLQTAHSTYQIKIDEFGLLLHAYYGKKVENTPLDYLIQYTGRGFAGYARGQNRPDVTLDALPQEYPTWGGGDLREPCLSITDEAGQECVDLRYDSYEILDEKPKMAEPMPQLFGNKVPTLIITMRDKALKVAVHLYYSVFDAEDAISRRAVIINEGDEKLMINRALSMGMDFAVEDMDLVSFHGSWATERQAERTKVTHAKLQLDSVRGASSHHMNPFAILCDHAATEDSGNAYGFAFLYSGNFLMNVQKDQVNTLRFVAGIAPEHFCYELTKKTPFETPEIAMAYSENGFANLSHQFHNLFREHLICSEWKDKRRPILLNSWEACYFDFNGEKLLHLAKQAADVGVEMLVMDDGWFGKREDDTSGLGDWVVNEEKLGMPLSELATKINALGLEFGIWIEPEMISEDSDLYRAHPEYAFHLNGRDAIRSRNQLVLDMSRGDVIDYLEEKISAVLACANISYVKWDMNRSLSDVCSYMLPLQRQGEVYHRYMLGVYDLLNRLTKKFPHILWEGCTGGGGRFDAGMLYYFPQIWCSDNTDAYARLFIQYGTSFAYPMSTMGSHVSICPNHQTNRTTSMDMRFAVAVSGTFGYELNLEEVPNEEKEKMKEQVDLAKRWHPIITNGDYYRLTNPFENSRYAAWGFVDKNRENALAFFVLLKTESNPAFVFLKVKGLSRNAIYSVKGEGEFGGDALMNAGIMIPYCAKDYDTKWFEIKKIR